MEFFLQLQQATPWLHLLPLLVALVGGLLRFYRLPLALRYLVGAVAWSLTIELAAAALRLQHLPNLLLIPLDVVGELTLLALMYQAALRSAALNRWLPIGLALFASYALLSMLDAPVAVKFRADLQITENCLLLALVVLYFRQLLSQLTVRRLEREPLFWVSAGLFIYCLGKIQIVLFSDYLLLHYSRQFNQAVWGVHKLLIMVLNSSYAVALWMRPRK
ncbi:hypothetical protein HHL22_08595 [Hymenobacter sp. RP-2-7]|uniref:Lysoplasmalogenase n=1 Tax=Hymenobacter polaris TaxID=2682546 RepID=A0A7Y0ADD0_9BACT|nr:hypothetical protein [Hymenobacter polaris]NML65260.1 hypothetical protein [Hymenobacter polaris]